MRRQFACGILFSLVPTHVWSASDEIPRLDVRPVCRGIASQSADPGVGQRSRADTLQQCLESEQAVRDQLKQQWSSFSAADKRHCVTLATTGGESSNTELLTCLEMARDVRVPRLASTAEASKPIAPAPTTQPAAASPTAEKDLSRTQGNGLKSGSEIAEAEADSAKASEALAQLKLADAQAALKKAREEARAMSADLERVKAEAQSAKEAEAAVKVKLAEAVAARGQAKQACGDQGERHGFGSRLRKWLGRPASPNQ